MKLTKEVADKVADISCKWTASVLHFADRCGINRNLFIMHCTRVLMKTNATTDFTNLDISRLESEVTE